MNHLHKLTGYGYHLKLAAKGGRRVREGQEERAMTGTDLAAGQKRYDTSGVEWTVEFVGECIAVVRNDSYSSIAL